MLLVICPGSCFFFFFFLLLSSDLERLMFSFFCHHTVRVIHNIPGMRCLYLPNVVSHPAPTPPVPSATFLSAPICAASSSLPSTHPAPSVPATRQDADGYPVSKPVFVLETRLWEGRPDAKTVPSFRRSHVKNLLSLTPSIHSPAEFFCRLFP